MKKTIFLAYTVIVVFFPVVFAQESDKLDMDLIVSDEQKIELFVGFIVAVIALFVYLARDVILKRKTEYDKKDLESKKNKDYDKYHSDWSDDYEDFGTRKYSREEKEFQEAISKSTLPDYYSILGIKSNATPQEIKIKYRELAKKTHPDKSKKEETKEKMAEINKAYEVLSNKELREKYDKYFKK